jgi:two-component system chemotaxis response regulator CheY
MKARILLIEDDPDALLAIEILLSHLGYKVETARNGREGLKMFRANAPDLVLTDIIMPEAEGIETIIAMRRLQPNAKIVAMSGGGPMNRVSLLDMTLKLGASDTLAKPFDGEQLADAVRTVLKQPAVSPTASGWREV